jgi:hypothetical protein
VFLLEDDDAATRGAFPRRTRSASVMPPRDRTPHLVSYIAERRVIATSRS